MSKYMSDSEISNNDLRDAVATMYASQLLILSLSDANLYFQLVQILYVDSFPYMVRLIVVD